MILRWTWLLLLLLATSGARAHVTTTGLATMELRKNEVIYSLSVIATDFPDEVRGSLLAAADGDRPNAERIAAVMREAVVVRTGDRRCEPGRTRIQGSQTGETRIRLELALHCPASGAALVLRENWQPLFGEHYRTIVSLRGEAGSREYVLGEGAHEAQLELNAPASGWSGFLLLGVEHILTGFDHLLFLLALLVNQRRVWPVVRIVTAFTVAHSVTLSLAALQLIAVGGRIVEPVIAASIVWVAVENLLFAGSAWRRVLVAFVFGLVHGLGFAGALGELGLAGMPLVRALIGFNVGVELGQVACVVVFLPLFVWASRPPALARLPQAASVLVAVMGAFWFVERVFFD
jgi:hypothetical protein